MVRGGRDKAAAREANATATHVGDDSSDTDGEGDPRAVWRAHSKHFFILTESGRPVFSRYGSEFHQSAMMGLLQAIVSKSLHTGDAIRAVTIGQTKVVFVLKGPLYLIAASSTQEPTEHLQRQLEHLHGCIVFVLTEKIFARLKKNPSYDMRNLLVGTRGSMLGIIGRANRSLSLLLESMPVLPLSRQLRASITSLLQSGQATSLAFAIVIAGHKLVAFVQMKKKAYRLQPFDFVQVTNFVQSSPSLRGADCWTPVCLPRMNASGFLHAYVAFATKRVCLLLVSSSTSQRNFEALSTDKAAIITRLQGQLSRGIEASLDADGANTGVAMLPGLLHFVYMWDSVGQYTRCAYPARFQEHKLRKMLLRAYQRVFVRLRAPHPVVKQTAETTELATIVGVNTATGCLLACFDRLFTPSEAYAACDKLIKAIKRKQDVLTAPPATWQR